MLFSQSNPERSRQTEHYVGHARQHALVAVGGTAEAKKGSMTGGHGGAQYTHTRPRDCDLYSMYHECVHVLYDDLRQYCISMRNHPHGDIHKKHERDSVITHVSCRILNKASTV